MQDDVDEQKHFRTSLQTLEKQTESLQHKLQAAVNNKDSVKVGLSPCFNPKHLHHTSGSD